MKKISIGITGSTGSLGKELLKYKKYYKFIKYTDDIRSKKKLNFWFNKYKFEAIIHLAAIVPIKKVNKDQKKAYSVNCIGTRNIVKLACSHKVNWFFFSSTSHVYSSTKYKISEKNTSKPISYYGKTKKLAENIVIKECKKNNINYCIGRIFSTTNKNQKENYLVPDLKRKIKQSKKMIILKNLNHYRDFISMSVITRIIFILLKKKYKGIINLGTGKTFYLKDIAICIAKKYKKKIKFEDNKKASYLVANIDKLKKIYKKNIYQDIKNLIF